MSNWSGGILTTKGQALQAKVDAGQTTLTLTKMKIGSGILPNGQSLQSLNDLVIPELNVPISGISASGNITTIIGVITNSGVTNGFSVRELGLFAQDPILGEILYSITTDSAPDYLPPEGGAVTVSEEFSINIVVSNTANVTATINPNGLITTTILNQKISEHNNDQSAHSVAIEKHNSSLNAHAGLLHLWQPTHAYAVGDIVYSPNLPSYAYAECTIAGTTAATEPTWPAVDSTVTDGTVTWAIRDVRDARKLQTARKINGIDFDGSADITISAGLLAASQSQAVAGIDDTVAITPSKLRNALNASGSAPIYACRAWVNFCGAPLSGTYTQSGTLVTVTMVAHGLSTDMVANVSPTTGTGVPGSYPVTVVSANTYTYTAGTSLTTSGNITQNLYIRGSGNVSSITDNGVGNYTVNFATAMPDINYDMVGSTTSNAAYPNNVSSVVDKYYNGIYTTSAMQIGTGINTTGYSKADLDFVSLNFFR